MRLLILIVINLALAFSSYSKSYAVIDIQVTLASSKAVLEMQKKIEDASHNIQKEILETEKELKLLESKILEKKASMSEAEYQKQVNEFYLQSTNFQKSMQSKKARLDEAYAEAMSKVHEAISKIIKQISLERKIDIVFSTSMILYASADVNITSEIIKRLNEELKIIKINYK